MTMSPDELRAGIEELVERATDLEAKAAEAGLLEPPAVEASDLDFQALNDRVAELEDLVFALTNSTEVATPAPAAGDLPDDFTNADADLPEDWAPAEPGDDTPKSYMPCPACGRKDADVYADGTARCEHDGSPLMVEEKALDVADEVDDAELEALINAELPPMPEEEPEEKALPEPADAPDITALLERRKALADD